MRDKEPPGWKRATPIYQLTWKCITILTSMALPECTSKIQPWLGQAQNLGGTEEEAVRAKVSEGWSSSSPFNGTQALSLVQMVPISQ